MADDLVIVKLDGPSQKIPRTTVKGGTVLHQNRYIGTRQALTDAFAQAIQGMGSSSSIYVLQASGYSQISARLPVPNAGLRYPICIWPTDAFTQEQVVEAYHEYLEDLRESGWLTIDELGADPKQLLPKEHRPFCSHVFYEFVKIYGPQANNLLLSCLCLWRVPAFLQEDGVHPIKDVVISLERYNGDTPIKDWIYLTANLNSGLKVLELFPQLVVPMGNPAPSPTTPKKARSSRHKPVQPKQG
jgi:hypothetical protein